MLHNYIGTEHILLGLHARGEERRRRHPGREGDAPHRGARGHRPAPEREGERRQGQGDAAPLRVLPRPDRGGRARRARPAGRAATTSWPRIVQVLCRRTRNNPVLIGEPGVGKTALVEGLANKIVQGDVPVYLAEKRILALDISLIVAGHQVPRAVRGAAQDDHAGAHREPQHHHLHRRAAHAGGRGLGRGQPGRRQHPEARALPRRDPVHRRHHARRVPQVHREGPLAGAALPGGEGGLAHRGGDDPDPARDQGPLREVPPRRLPATRRWRPRSTSPAATSPTASCPTRPSTSSTRRAAA